ncbi:MAG TPA: hypothetical protein PKL13_04990 [bacterium]|nr:hypothetical protein [bacterium]
MLFTIKEKKVKPFTTSEGKKMDYAWYKALREDGVTIKFGSMDCSHEIGDEVEIELEKTESIQNEKPAFRYKEIVK